MFHWKEKQTTFPSSYGHLATEERARAMGMLQPGAGIHIAYVARLLERVPSLSKMPGNLKKTFSMGCHKPQYLSAGDKIFVNLWNMTGLSYTCTLL